MQGEEGDDDNSEVELKDSFGIVHIPNGAMPV